jgi:hypothetical protein
VVAAPRVEVDWVVPPFVSNRSDLRRRLLLLLLLALLLARIRRRVWEVT